MKSFYEMMQIMENYWEDPRSMGRGYKNNGLSTDVGTWEEVSSLVGEIDMKEDFDYLWMDGNEHYDLKLYIESEKDEEWGGGVVITWPVSWRTMGSLKVYPEEEGGVTPVYVLGQSASEPQPHDERVQEYPNPGPHLERVPVELKNRILGVLKERMDSAYTKAMKRPMVFELLPDGRITFR